MLDHFHQWIKFCTNWLWSRTHSDGNCPSFSSWTPGPLPPHHLEKKRRRKKKWVKIKGNDSNVADIGFWDTSVSLFHMRSECRQQCKFLPSFYLKRKEGKNFKAKQITHLNFYCHIWIQYLKCVSMSTKICFWFSRSWDAQNFEKKCLWNRLKVIYLPTELCSSFLILSLSTPSTRALARTRHAYHFDG